MFLPPTSWTCHHHNVNNMTLSPTSLSPTILKPISAKLRTSSGLLCSSTRWKQVARQAVVDWHWLQRKIYSFNAFRWWQWWWWRRGRWWWRVRIIRSRDPRTTEILKSRTDSDLVVRRSLIRSTSLDWFEIQQNCPTVWMGEWGQVWTRYVGEFAV